MTDETPEADDADSFEAALADLLRRAHRNDVEVTGGYEVAATADTPGLDVVVTVVEERNGDE